MLIQLLIENYLFIEKAVIDFHAGLNIVTGETGAGKSVFLGALAAALGQSLSSGEIKPGADFLRVAAVFDIEQDADLKKMIAELGISGMGGADTVLSLRRELTREGKSRCYLNNTVINVSSMKSIGRYLIDIHSQHETQLLYKAAQHRYYYDCFLSLNGEYTEFSAYYRTYMHAVNTLKAVIDEEKRLAEEKDYLEFTVRELKDNLLTQEEYDNARDNIKKMVSAEKLNRNIDETDSLLSQQALPALTQASVILQKSADIDQKYLSYAKRLDSAAAEIKDILSEVSTGKSRSESGAIDALNEKLSRTERLRKKYNCQIDGLFSRLYQAEEKLLTLTASGEKRKDAEKAVKETEYRAVTAASVLHVKRTGGRDSFNTLMQEELSYLNMKGSQLGVEIKINPDSSGVLIESRRAILNENGFDTVEFMYKSSPETPWKPLKDIASGGEASRIMLALKKVILESLSAHTMILDEIDTGIGGNTAVHVGKKIKEISAMRQLIVITHLPQIAKYADAHFKVMKTDQNGKTITTVDLLDTSKKAAEISRMISGNENTERDVGYAREYMKN